MSNKHQLSNDSKTEILKQVIEDRTTGNFTDYRDPVSDTLCDIVFAIPDALSGTPSCSSVSEAKQEFYNQCRLHGG